MFIALKSIFLFFLKKIKRKKAVSFVKYHHATALQQNKKKYSHALH